MAAILFVCAITALHLLSLDSLFQSDRASSEVRHRWLDSVRLLGDLSDEISDVRAAEAEILLSREPAVRNQWVAELDRLVAAAAQSADRYRSIQHDTEEKPAFQEFELSWNEHVQDAKETAALTIARGDDAAFSEFDKKARSSFSKADDALHRVLNITQLKVATARDNATQAVANTRRLISDLILGVLALFVALVAYLWWAVSRPLVALSSLMRRLAAEDTGFVIPFQTRRDEIGELSRSLAVFRRNTIELLKSRASLAGQAEILVRSLDKERALADEQRNFISTMSHEFRTPLMAIDGHAQRLIATQDKASTAKERAEKIRSAALRMTNLVASLTDAIELGQRDFRVNKRPFDLRSMLEELARYHVEIGVGGELRLRLGPLPEKIMGDPELLYHVFDNLISNAFKYSPDQSVVTLGAGEQDGFVNVVIEDEGIGIPRDEIDRIRERYYRASNVGSIPGTGLGLNLVDEILRGHDGRLKIESRESSGTRVTVLLPAGSFQPPSEYDVAHDSLRGGRSGNSEPDLRGSGRARLCG